MKILVTGATGGLGEIIVNNLLQRGHQVVATSRDENKAKTLDFYSKVIYRPYTIELENKSNLFEYFDKPDAMIHCAWDKLGAAEYKNPMHTQVLLPQHTNFLSNLIANGLKDITVVGTCYEYGIQEGELSEDMPAKPTVEYSISKNILRETLQKMQKEQPFSLKWMRVFYVFGEVKGRKNLYTLLDEALKRGDTEFNMSGGEQVRDFLSSNQIADLIVQAALQTKVDGVINCCSGIPVVLNTLIDSFLADRKATLKLNKGFYPYPDYEPMTTWGSVQKLNQIVKK